MNNFHHLCCESPVFVTWTVSVTCSFVTWTPEDESYWHSYHFFIKAKFSLNRNQPLKCRVKPLLKWSSLTYTCAHVNARICMRVFCLLITESCLRRRTMFSCMFPHTFIALLSILLVCDVALVYISYLSTMSKGPSVQLVFGFEVNLFFLSFQFFLNLRRSCATPSWTLTNWNKQLTVSL